MARTRATPSHFHWWWVYGFLTGCTLLIAQGTPQRRRGAISGAAVILSVVWLFWNACHWLKPSPYNTYFPLVDAAVPILLAYLWRNSLEGWKVLLILLFLADLATHVSFWAAGDWSYHAKYGYDLTLNILWLAKLGTVSIAACQASERGFPYPKGRRPWGISTGRTRRSLR